MEVSDLDVVVLHQANARIIDSVVRGLGLRDDVVVAKDVAHMHGTAAQVRALATLARHRLSDRTSLDALASLFPNAVSVDVHEKKVPSPAPSMTPGTE